jgi:hypothetical protein
MSCRWTRGLRSSHSNSPPPVPLPIPRRWSAPALTGRPRSHATLESSRLRWRSRATISTTTGIVSCAVQHSSPAVFPSVRPWTRQIEHHQFGIIRSLALDVSARCQTGPVRRLRLAQRGCDSRAGGVSRGPASTVFDQDDLEGLVPGNDLRQHPGLRFHNFHRSSSPPAGMDLPVALRQAARVQSPERPTG